VVVLRKHVAPALDACAWLAVAAMADWWQTWLEPPAARRVGWVDVSRPSLWICVVSMYVASS